MMNKIYAHLPGDFPWQVHWLEEVSSTNDYAKELARQGAPHGTVIVANHQTGGRGRMGRSFSSPKGLGIYLSVILRPGCPAGQLMHLTCAVGTVICDAVEAYSGCRPGLKWINDLILKEKKLGGILTELSLGKDGLVDFAVVGIGINCSQKQEDFPPELQNTAISLAMHTGKPTDRCALTGAVLTALYHAALPGDPAVLMDAYRRDCITLGRTVTVLQEPAPYCAVAEDVDETGALMVALPDGTHRRIQSGEVSIRGSSAYL